MLEEAVNYLWLKISRMGKWVEKAINYSDGDVIFKLLVTPNYEDNMLSALSVYIDNFLKNYILKEWYIKNNMMQESGKCAESENFFLGNILSVVHYRKKTIKRPINPIL